MIDPLGNAVGVGCHNCANLTDDDCSVRLLNWDDDERTSDEGGRYVDRLIDYCPDWESKYRPGFTTANLLANRNEARQ
jgi:hypothetical protein